MTPEMANLIADIEIDALLLMTKDILIDKGVMSSQEYDATLTFHAQKKVIDMLRNLTAEKLQLEKIEVNDDNREIVEQTKKEISNKILYYNAALTELCK